MCHKIPLENRLAADSLSIPLAELFLTKAQIVEINRKDALDLYALLLDHEVGPSDNDTINSDRLASLCGKDWGLYTTINKTLDFLIAQLAEIHLEEPADARVRQRVESLRVVLEQAPKSTAWKLRAKVGTKMRWYELPEEVQRT
jgi:hypothetical protein